MRQNRWTPWRKARAELREEIPDAPGVYMFGLIIPERNASGEIVKRWLDVVYIGVGGSKEVPLQESGLRARLTDHLTGRSHVEAINQAVANQVAFLSWLVDPLAYSLEVDLIRLYTPMFNKTHNRSPREITETELRKILQTPVEEEVWDGPVYIPARVRTLLRGELPFRLESEDFAVVSQEDMAQLKLLLRVPQEPGQEAAGG